ncbi:MAG: hypothetical protein M2R45_05340 [Verrucomicrobia subdivision 3 bacterium]|nr:hypothetical protein [Limisphaerales bacterium]MCS1417835.1 hypothetical protein [Limisphaerales bacterium]
MSGIGMSRFTLSMGIPTSVNMAGSSCNSPLDLKSSGKLAMSVRPANAKQHILFTQKGLPFTSLNAIARRQFKDSFLQIQRTRHVIRVPIVYTDA